MLTTNLRKQLLTNVYRRGVKRIVEGLQDSQWYDEATQHHRQIDKLTDILIHGKLVPYYKPFLNGIDVSSDPLQVLKGLPILEKISIQNNLDLLVHPNIKPIGIGATSGSTGIGLQFYYDEYMLTNTEVLTRFFRGWYGIEPGDKTLKIWGRPLKSAKNKLRAYISDLLRGIKTIDPWKLDDKSLEQNWVQILKFKPKCIYGYATSIAHFTKWIELNHFENLARQIGLKVIISTAETLLSSDKQIIKEVFGCPVVEEYGAAEVSIIAHECPMGNFHIANESLYLECVDDLGNEVPLGTPGHFIVTSFMNRIQPLIRYRIGDFGTLLPSTCSCGRKSPLLRLTGAKVIELIKTESGKVFSAEILDYMNLALLKNPKYGIDQFRITQKDLRTFIVEVVANKHFNEQSKSDFSRLFMDSLGEQDLVLLFEVKHQLDPLPSGKLLYFTSEIL